MTIQQTIDIPSNHRFTLEIPREVPAGKAILAFTLTPVEDRRTAAEEIVEPNKFDAAAQSLGYQDHLDYLRVNTPATIEEAIAQAQAKLADPNRQPFSRHYGAVQGVYGDGMKYQRKMRNEWPG